VFDRDARKSLEVFTASGGLKSLQTQLGSEYPLNVLACATLQNVTGLDPFECCRQLREQGCVDELAKLVVSEDELVASYATAVVANLRAYDPNPQSNDALDEAIRMRRLAAIVEQMRTDRAVAAMQAVASRWVQRKRAAALGLASESAFDTLEEA
jgi:hypothetical protein